MAHKILVATRNLGKVQEFADMLADMNLEWLSLDDIQINDEVDETGSTFKENAILKASAYAASSGLITLADDSGLEVDALDGKPGVRTARYGGEGLSSRQRYEYLLKNMKGIPLEKRSARFRCVIALADAAGTITTASGVCEGLIALEPVGTGGFGYDPVFYLPKKSLTMAQLYVRESNLISHRGRAMQAISPELLRVAAGDR